MSDHLARAAKLLGWDVVGGILYHTDPPWSAEDPGLVTADGAREELERRLREKGYAISIRIWPDKVFAIAMPAMQDVMKDDPWVDDSDETQARLAAAVEAAERLDKEGKWDA